MLDLDQAIRAIKRDYKNPNRANEETEVIGRYGHLFHPQNLKHLSKEDFASFLFIENNKHWNHIHRQVNIITQDMNKLRKALGILLDERKPLIERLDFLFSKKGPYVRGLGRAIVTPILLVVYPTKYGVYNKRTADGLKQVGLEPKFKKGASFSEKYLQINDILINLASQHKMSLFRLDEVWWRITEGKTPVSVKVTPKIWYWGKYDRKSAQRDQYNFLKEKKILLQGWGNTGPIDKCLSITEWRKKFTKQFGKTEKGRIKRTPDSLWKIKDFRRGDYILVRNFPNQGEYTLAKIEFDSMKGYVWLKDPINIGEPAHGVKISDFGTLSKAASKKVKLPKIMPCIKKIDGNQLLPIVAGELGELPTEPNYGTTGPIREPKHKGNKARPSTYVKDDLKRERANKEHQRILADLREKWMKKGIRDGDIKHTEYTKPSYDLAVRDRRNKTIHLCEVKSSVSDKIIRDAAAQLLWYEHFQISHWDEHKALHWKIQKWIVIPQRPSTHQTQWLKELHIKWDVL